VRLGLRILIVTSVLFFPMLAAEATPDFGIAISNTCYTMIKYNLTTNCPTYEAIMAVFPDSSNQIFSGGFIYKDNMLQRENPPIEEHFQVYRYDDSITLFIDPPGNIRDKINMITIESRLPEYKLRDLTIINYTHYLGTGRYIDNCSRATLDGSQWLYLLGDTLRYMQNNCDPEFTNFNSTKETYLNYTRFDISTSNKWLHDTWVQSVKDNCLTKFMSC